MNRRSFLRGLLAGVAGVVATKCLPAMPERRELPPAPDMSIRFIEMYETAPGTFVHRMDILYGFGNLTPSPLMCRFADDTPKRLGARARRRMKRQQAARLAGLRFHPDAFSMAWSA